MTFRANVVRVFIASPGDTGSARRVLREAIEDWNSLNAEANEVVLLPVMWERDAVPEMGERPQAIINRQLVEVADVLIGTFWTRLGTPTGEAASGTAEEIELFVDADKPTLIYFSAAPVIPDSVDLDQYSRLREFRDDLEQRGLVDTYESDADLFRKVTFALTRMMRDRFAGLMTAAVEPPLSPAPDAGSPGASLLARIERERELSGFNRSGNPRYRTRYRLMLGNRGNRAAENVTLTPQVDGDVSGDAPRILQDSAIGRLPPGGSVEFPMMVTMGTAQQWDLIMSWEENGNQFEERQSMT